MVVGGLKDEMGEGGRKGGDGLGEGGDDEVSERRKGGQRFGGFYG